MEVEGCSSTGRVNGVEWPALSLEHAGVGRLLRRIAACHESTWGIDDVAIKGEDEIVIGYKDDVQIAQEPWGSRRDCQYSANVHLKCVWVFTWDLWKVRWTSGTVES